MNAPDTPSGTRMMWAASVNAICARAHGTGFTATRASAAATLLIAQASPAGTGSFPITPEVCGSYSRIFSTSRPCAVSAQITATETTMIAMPQIGYHGSHANAPIPLTIARITPTVRAHTAPEKAPNPASTTQLQMMRLIQPQVVRSNWKTYLAPFT